MGDYSIQQQRFISEYRKAHGVPTMMNDDAVVAMIRDEMVKTGKIYPAFSGLIETKTSGQGKAKTSVWNNVQQTDNLQEVHSAVQPKKTQIYTLTERNIARKYIAAMLKAQIQEAIFGEQGFNVVANPNKFSGSEMWQEFEVAGAKIVHDLKLGSAFGIKEPLNRAGLENELNTAYRQVEELEALVEYPAQFDKKYKEIMHGKSMDYGVVIDYLKAVSQHQSAYIEDKLSTLEKLKEPAERFTKTIEIPVVNSYNKWAGKQGVAGQLTGLGIDMAIAYMSGGMSTVTKLTEMTGKGVAEVVTKKAVQSGIKKETAEIAGIAAEIQTDYVVGSGLNATLFTSIHTVSAVSDGDLTSAELSELSDSYWSFFRMGYVGSAVSGPAGLEFAKGVAKLINNKKTISIILNSSLKQPTTLGKVLTNLSKNTEIIKKATGFGTSFLVNTGYMAMDEGISYGEALENLAQMEGVSKLVMAFLGGKTTKFLTPEKVQKITTDIENCKVEVAVYKGQKAIKVTTPEGQEHFFASHEELIVFVADRIYTQAGIGPNNGVNGVNGEENAESRDKTETKEKTARNSASNKKKAVKKSQNSEAATVQVLPNQNSNGFVVKIGNQEFTANTFEEVKNIIETKSPKGANIDFSALELREDLCAGNDGVQKSGNIFSRVIQYMKNRNVKNHIIKQIMSNKRANYSQSDIELVEKMIDKLQEAGLNGDKQGRALYKVGEISAYDFENFIDLCHGLKPGNEQILIDIFIRCKDNSKVQDKLLADIANVSTGAHQTWINQEDLVKFFKALVDSNVSAAHIDSITLPHSQMCYKDFMSEKDWELLLKVLPTLAKTDPSAAINKNIVTLIRSLRIPKIIDNMVITEKATLLNGLSDLPEDIVAELKEKGLDINTIKAKLKSGSQTVGFEVRTDKAGQNRFLKRMGNNSPQTDNLLRSQKLSDFLNQCADSGLPLKYSRNQFIKDLNKLLEQLPVSEREKVLKHLNITIDKNSFNGFIKLDEFDLSTFSESSHETIGKIKECVDKFAKKNEVLCSDPEIKALLNDIIQGFPEFASVLGRIDGNHTNKLEIHTLQVLQRALNNPNYQKLTNSEKNILKFAILMHDFGKIEGVDTEHAPQSAIYARSILDKFNLSQAAKEDIVNLVRYHHYKEGFKDGVLELGFGNYFRTDREERIAIIFAQSDYEARFGQELKLSEYEESRLRMRRKDGYAYTEIDVDHNKVQGRYKKYKYTLPDGRSVEVPVCDMRQAKAADKASQYGWYGKSKEQTVAETVILRHNCGIYDVRNVLESYVDPNKDMNLSANICKLSDVSGNLYGDVVLFLSIKDGNVGLQDYQNQGSGRKKGFNQFVAGRHKNVYNSKFSRTEWANWRGNEHQVLKPMVEKIGVCMDITPEQMPIELVQLSHEFGVDLVIIGDK